MAEEAGHDKSLARACRARPARAADSPRFAPTRPCLAGMERPGRPAPRPVPIRSAYQTPLLSAAYASSKQSPLTPFPLSAKTAFAPLLFLSPQSLKGGFAGALLAGEEPFSAVYHTLEEKYSFFCRTAAPIRRAVSAAPFGQIILPA